jgi:uncharacterized caspase-like protein
LLRVLGFVWLYLALLPVAGVAETRAALLIGNQSYDAQVGPLRSPHRDIAIIGRALRSLGFEVVEVKDAGYRALDIAIKRHIQVVRRAGPGSISFIYYSGHGAADPESKVNYLIPVDVSKADDEDLWTASLNLNSTIDSIRALAPDATHYIVFDACRNELNLMRKGKKALADKGFHPIAYAPGVLIAYATAPGRTAVDGEDRTGGPYARALAEEIVKPGTEAMTMFRLVALRVNREIGQDPWMSASTLPEFYFAGKQVNASAPLPPAPMSEAALAWAEIRKTSNPEILEAYNKQFGDTVYGAIARARLEALRKRQLAAAPNNPREASAQATDTIKQIKLAERQIEGFIAAQKDMSAVAEKLQTDASGQTDPKLQAELDAVAKKHGFADFADYDVVAANISMIMAGIDPQTKAFTVPELAIAKEVQEVQFDKSIPDKEKAQMLTELNEALKMARPIQHASNIELVIKYYEKIDAVLQ